MQKIILPGITTTYNSNTEEQINEIKKLSVPQVALFLSGASESQRQIYYKKLGKIKNLIIPFVHARSDMKPEEYEQLCKVFKTRCFNLHSEEDYPLKYDLSNFKDIIYIENSEKFEEEDLSGYAGICLDLSHLEDWRMTDEEKYRTVNALLKKYPVGANHISAIRPKLELDQEGLESYNNHYMKNISEFNYLKNYPSRFFGKYIAVELINPLEEQLRLMNYLIKLLKDKGIKP